jgi:uncharacterized phiE125 gp8 family phage protein
MPLDTLAGVKARLGIATSADDALLALLQQSADAFVTHYCGREFAPGSFTEYFPAESAALRLRNFPVAAVNSVRVDRLGGFAPATELDPSAYAVDAARGMIVSRVGPFLRLAVLSWADGRGPGAVRVEYTTAAAVPEDVKQAAGLLVGHWYRHVKTQQAAEYQNVTQQTFGDATAIFAKEQIAGLPLPADALAVLALYRNRGV